MLLAILCLAVWEDDMEQINITGTIDGVQTVQLGGVMYRLKMAYDGEHWNMTLRDADDNDLVTDIRVVTNYPLLIMHQRSVPTLNGQLMAVRTNGSEQISLNDFVGGRIKLVYIPWDEVR